MTKSIIFWAWGSTALPKFYTNPYKIHNRAILSLFAFVKSWTKIASSLLKIYFPAIPFNKPVKRYAWPTGFLD